MPVALGIQIVQASVTEFVTYGTKQSWTWNEPGYKKMFFSSEWLIKKGAVLNSPITEIFLIQSLQQ